MIKLRHLFLAATIVSAGSVSAALPVEVTTAATTMIADAGAYSAAFIPVTVAVMVAFIAIKWVKKFLSRAS